jgi:hypothetical protein
MNCGRPDCTGIHKTGHGPRQELCPGARERHLLVMAANKSVQISKGACRNMDGNPLKSGSYCRDCLHKMSESQRSRRRRIHLERKGAAEPLARA